MHARWGAEQEQGSLVQRLDGAGGCWGGMKWNGAMEGDMGC